MAQTEFLWKDAGPNRLLNASMAFLGYIFFWGTEVGLLYFLVQELAAKTSGSFAIAGGLVLIWTIVSTFATVRLHHLTKPSRVLYLKSGSIGFSGGSHEDEFPFKDVDKIIVAHAGEGFEAVITAQEAMVSVPLRDRKGFIAAAKVLPALKGKIASTGMLD